MTNNNNNNKTTTTQTTTFLGCDSNELNLVVYRCVISAEVNKGKQSRGLLKSIKSGVHLNRVKKVNFLTFQMCLKGVSRKFQGRSKIDFGVLQRSFKVVAREFQGCLKED